MSVRRLSRLERERAVEMREAGKSYSQIANAIGCSASAIYYQCLRAAAELPKPRQLPIGVVGPTTMKRGDHIVRRFTEEEDRHLLDLDARGLRDVDMGREMGRRPHSVRQRLMTLARREARMEAQA